ncbi:MAG: hypothetical protein ACRC7N_11750 [Clostridium sp.]
MPSLPEIAEGLKVIFFLSLGWTLAIGAAWLLLEVLCIFFDKQVTAVLKFILQDI